MRFFTLSLSLIQQVAISVYFFIVLYQLGQFFKDLQEPFPIRTLYMSQATISVLYIQYFAIQIVWNIGWYTDSCTSLTFWLNRLSMVGASLAVHITDTCISLLFLYLADLNFENTSLGGSKLLKSRQHRFD